MYVAPIRAGDSSVITVGKYHDPTGVEISADEGWSLKFCVKGNGNNLEKNADENWNITLAKADTQDLVAGEAQWAFVATKDDLQVTVDHGLVTILPKILGATGDADFRSKNKKLLDEVQSAIQALVTKKVKQYSVQGRSLTHLDLPELMAMESALIPRVAREERMERIRRGEPDQRVSKVRFTR